jgi:DNA repair exonuclease SbcCD ATPase subunit
MVFSFSKCRDFEFRFKELNAHYVNLEGQFRDVEQRLGYSEQENMQLRKELGQVEELKQRLREQGSDYEQMDLMRNELETWRQKFMS